MTQKKPLPLCTKCKHSIKNSSCGPCSDDKGTEMIENIAKELGIEPQYSEKDDLKALKLSCKILNRYPEDYESVDPYECKYFMSSFMSFR